MAAKPGQIVPVDSEHSALAQCLRGGTAEEVAKLVLTASGGPFRGWTAEDLEDVTPEQAGAHPTWSMGPMNTLNSASLVNKGLELIETHLLFGIGYDRIEVVVHPQSIVHSMVTFTDGSTLAQASPPDMKLPIALALGWPERVPAAAPACDFSTASTWEFEPLDAEVFPAVELARQAGQRGGCLTAVYNAANEEAAAAFLRGRIRFPAIVRTIAEVLSAADQWAAEPATVEDVLDAQRWARMRAGRRRIPGGRLNQMMFVVGIVLFALAILVSVALHECGHMWVARATGMKVRRYFVGFGPTLWSTRRPNQLGETEYGVKAIPLGGFCDIAGMTSIEELAPDEHERAMFRQKTWKRAAVLFAGPGMNFLIGLVLIYAIAVIWGLPNLHPPTTAIVGETSCVAPRSQQGRARQTAPVRAGRRGGHPAGRRRSSRSATPTSPTLTRWSTAVRKLDGPTPFVVERDGEQFTTVVDVTQTQRFTVRRRHEASTVGAIGISAAQFGPTQHNALSAVPATFAFTGDLAVELGKSLAKIPTKIGALVHGHRRWGTRPGDADQRGRRQHHRRRRRRPRLVGGVLVLPGPAEFRARCDQPDPAAAVRRWPHRDCGVREDPQYDSVGARHGARGAGELSQADARYLRNLGSGGRLHAADRDR